ncbi:MFS transporter [Actinocorallia sp. API 0066]|uniref:MFS transporter n=1 Tax=Actinocorallia sp. API 0066 TaxID=2896846 RepID=UPI001E344D0E|nr:MFS transporter [Actinocorallia sp. API 0066]MCD0451672.1 MFS transporter [Actinocorallia sp. API 0066]
MPRALAYPAQARPGVLVAVLAFAGITVALMQTLVIPLVPRLPGLLGASTGDTAWTVTATLLAAAVATPVVGRLGDMYGKRRMLLVSLGLLVAGALVVARSDSLTPMLVGRTLQGLAAGVIPLGISVMRDELPPDRLGSATATMSSSLGVGSALGLPAAALIADHAHWHALFWTAAGLGLVAMGLVAAFVPESPVRGGGRFDVVGALGLSAALVCLLLVVSKGADWGWASRTTLLLLGAAVAVLALWTPFELRVRRPLVDLRTAARPRVLLTNVASVVFSFAMFGIALVLPQVLQLPEATGYGLGRTMLAVGLVMAPQGLVMMAVAPVSARISAARGPRTTLMLGALVVAAGYGLSLLMMAELWQFVLVGCVIGAGIGFGYGAMPALIMSAVPLSETAAANSLNTLMRAIGTSVSSAVTGAVLAGMTVAVGSAAFPSLDGLRLVLAGCAAASLVTVAIAAFIPPAPGERGDAPVPEPLAPAKTAPEVALSSQSATNGARRRVEWACLTVRTRQAGWLRGVRRAPAGSARSVRPRKRNPT